jgi:hypothetical protein
MASRAAVPEHPARSNCSFKGREFRSCVASLAFPERQGLALGVANARHASEPAHFAIDGAERFALLVGVRMVRSG